MAADERAHEHQFQKLLDNNPLTEGDAGRFEVNDYVKATAISEYFRKDSFRNLEGVETERDALAKAFGLEKATLLFYHALRDTIGEGTALDSLIEAEKSHLSTLMTVIMTDAKFRGLSDEW